VSAADLAAHVETMEFSGELLQVIRGVAIAMPPLRDRRSDIPLLVDHFMRRREGGTETAERDAAWIDSPTMARLVAYHWPGNVAELRRFLAQSGAALVRPR